MADVLVSHPASFATDAGVCVGNKCDWFVSNFRHRRCDDPRWSGNSDSNNSLVHLPGGLCQHAHGICLGVIDSALSGFGARHARSDACVALRRIGFGIILMKKSSKLPFGRLLGYAALVILAIISLGPIWIALKTALSGPTAWLTSAGSALPHDTTLFNFQRVLGF